MTGPRRGTALLVVLVTLALLGVLAAAGAFATLLRVRGARELARAPAALAVAESIAVDRLARWNGADAAMLAAGLATHSSSTSGASIVDVRVTPLERGRFILTATSDAVDARAARAGVWLAVRRESLAIAPLPAITTSAPFDLVGTARATRDDRAPDGWLDCPAPLPDIDAVVESAAAIPGLDFDALWTHAELRIDAGASLAPSPRAAGGACDATAVDVWGEPDAAGVSACRGYFPVVAASGPLHLRGGRGQGVLLVDGDLALDGDARFVGLVVVRGRVTLADDARIVGALVARDTAGAGSVARDRASVQRSACAVARAVAAAGAPHPDGAHAWAPRY